MERVKKIDIKILYLCFLITGFIFLVSGTSYAIFNASLNGDRVSKIQSDQVILTYTESDSITITDPTPKNDDEGMASSDIFTFTVDATGNSTVNYVVYLTEDEANTINNQYIKVYLTDNNNNVLVAPTKISDLDKYSAQLNSKVLYYNKFDLSGSKISHVYNLRTYLAKDFVNEPVYSETENSTTVTYNDVSYRFKVNIETIGANKPKLAVGMIPVYYDETDKVWRKADEANKNNSWYDYDAKKWANAVTVRDEVYLEKTVETSKTVAIDNPLLSIYTSGNKGVKSSTSEATFTFTAGAAGGTYSFDYSVSSESGYDKLTIKVNGTTVVNAISGVQSRTYTATALANETYEIVATYTKDSSGNSNDDQATISNFRLPAGASELAITSTGTYPWSIRKYKLYTNYTFEPTTRVYTLSGATYENRTGLYVCEDLTSTSCNTMYKVTGISGDTITSIDVYGSEYKENIRKTYKSSPIGTEIPMSAINTMMVWIPRYSYEVFNYNANGDSYSNPQEINIKFEIGTNESKQILCVDKIQGEGGDGTSEVCKTSGVVCTDDTCNGKMYTHPAFCFGDKNSDGTCPEANRLEGLWVSKFELSGTISAITAKPGQGSLVSQNVSSFSTNIMKMNDSGNAYGFLESEDTHMMKNMEWGAVAYLSHSRYGTCTNGECTDVKNNAYYASSSPYYMTGCGPLSATSTFYGATCNPYNEELGVLASTTQNVYGVYDMAGGAYDYVMSNVAYSSTQMLSSSSGFAGVDTSGVAQTGTAYPTSKHYDKYSYGTSYSDAVADKRSKLGDAVREVATNASINWYSDYGHVAYSSSPWFVRGGSADRESIAGVFGSDSRNGYSNIAYSSRFVLVP